MIREVDDHRAPVRAVQRLFELLDRRAVADSFRGEFPDRVTGGSAPLGKGPPPVVARDRRAGGIVFVRILGRQAGGPPTKLHTLCQCITVKFL